MSRIGRAPISIPAGVTVSVDDDNLVLVKGPKGQLSRKISSDLKITVEDGVISVHWVGGEDVKTYELSKTIIEEMLVRVNSGITEQLKKILSYDDETILVLAYLSDVIIDAMEE